LSPIRILIVDDFEGWRRQVRLLFQARPQWQIIAEVSDGPEAVQKAEELKPDLITLDIGLEVEWNRSRPADMRPLP
jgi:DNA-binding NarL/FixJ family response regulator